MGRRRQPPLPRPGVPPGPGRAGTHPLPSWRPGLTEVRERRVGRVPESVAGTEGGGLLCPRPGSAPAVKGCLGAPCGEAGKGAGASLLLQQRGHGEEVNSHRRPGARPLAPPPEPRTRGPFLRGVRRKPRLLAPGGRGGGGATPPGGGAGERREADGGPRLRNVRKENREVGPGLPSGGLRGGAARLRTAGRRARERASGSPWPLHRRAREAAAALLTSSSSNPNRFHHVRRGHVPRGVPAGWQIWNGLCCQECARARRGALRPAELLLPAWTGSDSRCPGPVPPAASSAPSPESPAQLQTRLLFATSAVALILFFPGKQNKPRPFNKTLLPEGCYKVSQVLIAEKDHLSPFEETHLVTAKTCNKSLAQCLDRVST
ncbi:uncharacterized protein LOC141519186 [Macrotis lagotis]|uniref:uncharacterized protein LOC141519186 n=1 Tax=Macrotis lagotis TaxID=92651 RepID=UPI003D693F03